MKIRIEAYLLILCSTIGITYAGPHRIRIKGDTILHEGTETTYTITVQNTHNKDYEDMVIAIEGLKDSGLKFCSAQSKDLELFTNTVDGVTQFEAFGGSLAMGQTATVAFRVQASHLENIGDLKSQQMTICVNGANFRRGVVRKTTTIYKAS